MSIIAQDLVREVARNTGGYIQSFATSVGDAATDINDTSLANHAFSSNVFRSKWWEAQSGQNSGEVRRITASTTIELTIVAASVATPVGTRYAIYDNNPAEILTAVNQAIREAGTALYEHVLDENTIMDDLSKNPSFEDSRTSLLFDSSDDKVTVAASAVYEDHFAGGGTIVVDIHPFSDGQASNGNIVDSGSGTSTGYQIWIEQETDGFCRIALLVYFSGTNAYFQSVERVVPIRKDSTLAFAYTWDDVDNNASMYISTEGGPLVRLAVAEATTPTGTGSSDTGVALLIGRDAAGINTWDGLISNLQYWDKERSYSKLQEYINKKTIIADDEPDLVGWWLTERGQGGSALDASGNGNDGTITGALWLESFNHWTFGGTDPAKSLALAGLNEKMHGTQAAELTAASGGAAQHRQFINTQNTSVGATLVHKRWVRADGTTRARIGIGGTNVTAQYSDYHSGNSQLELLTIEYFLEANDEDIYILCESATSQVGIFDLGWASIKNLSRYELPDGMRRPTSVTQQRIENSPSGDFLPLEGIQRRHGAILRIEGQRPLPELSSPSDVLPLDSRYAPILVEKASAILKGYMASRASGDRRAELLADQRTHQIAYEDLVGSPKTRMPRLVTEITKAWKTEGDELVLIP